jgi:hypothetical protein
MKGIARLAVVAALGLVAGCGSLEGGVSPMFGIEPSTTRVQTGQSVTLNAGAVEAGISDVSWSVQEGPRGGTVTAVPTPPGGAPSTRATYTAPATPGVYHVQAVINRSTPPGVTRSATITVTP